jgi:hypothetical protein
VIPSPPNSGVVLWVDCRPQPVQSAAQHSFKAENSKINIVPEQVTGAVVRIVAGASAGLTLIRPRGGNSHVVACGGLGTVMPGKSTMAVSVQVQKQAGTSARTEIVRTMITFQGVALPGRPLPPSKSIRLPFEITVAIA